MNNQLLYWSHEIKYKYSVYKTEFLQRYYSNSKEPRVIQTKLSERLLSLRIFPHDKYKIRPGEFLRTERRTISAPSDLEPTIRGNSNVLDLQGKFKFENLPCSCECHTENNGRDDEKVSHTNDDEIKIESTKPRGLFKYFGKKTLTQIFSPIIEIGSADIEELYVDKDSNLHNIQLSNNDISQDINNLIDITCDSDGENVDQENEEIDELTAISNHINNPPINETFNYSDINLHQIPGNRKYSYAEGIRPNISAPKSVADNHRNKDVWKSVLNEVSLSAALISTGGSPVSHNEFTNLKADFIDARSNKDIVSLSLDQEPYGDLLSMYNY